MLSLEIFVSVTVTDLEAYREAVLGVLRESGHHMVQLERFTPHTQDLLARVRSGIGMTDLYICVVGWEYGYVAAEAGGKSLTELEYGAARELNKPVLVFLAREGSVLHGRGEADERLLAFRSRLSTDHYVEYFSDEKELALIVASAVQRFEASVKSSTGVNTEESPAREEEDPLSEPFTARSLMAARTKYVRGGKSSSKTPPKGDENGHIPYEDAFARAFSIYAYLTGDLHRAPEVAGVIANSIVKRQVREKKRLGLQEGVHAGLVRDGYAVLDAMIFHEVETYWSDWDALFLQGRALLDEESLIIRFVTYLIHACTSRRCADLAVGVLKILFNYKYESVMNVYYLLHYDSSEGEDTLRRRKGRIFRQIQDRFRAFIRTTVAGPAGEMRFAEREDSSPWYEVILTLLDLLKHPRPSCLQISPDFDPSSVDLESYIANRSGSVSETDMELGRRHILMCRNCLPNVLLALKYEHPARRLGIPEFTHEHGLKKVHAPSKSRLTVPTISKKEMNSLRPRLP